MGKVEKNIMKFQKSQSISNKIFNLCFEESKKID